MSISPNSLNHAHTDADDDEDQDDHDDDGDDNDDQHHDVNDNEDVTVYKKNSWKFIAELGNPIKNEAGALTKEERQQGRQDHDPVIIDNNNE